VPVSDEIDNLRVVLVAARNPLNIGAAARAMSNFGFRHLRVVNPYQVAFRQARSAVGAGELLAQAEEYVSVAEAVNDCTLVVGTTAVRHRELHHPLRLLKDGARIIRKGLASKPVAILFGSERVGLSNKNLSHCHWLMHIPTREPQISMNLGQAVAVSLYEIARESNISRPAKTQDNTSASATEQERITLLLLDALHISGFIKNGVAGSSETRLRRMVRRLNLRQGDADLWLGILRQMVWKMRAGEKPPQ
jgi:TrmH family RNA methyltransferase